VIAPPDSAAKRSGANICPHCGAEPCVPAWRKLVLGPGASAHCEICGFRVGVGIAQAWLAMLPTLLLVALAAFGILTDPVALIVLLALCLAVTFTAYLVWVPLIPDELTNARMVEEARRARLEK
jgi:hypothetical protein